MENNAKNGGMDDAPASSGEKHHFRRSWDIVAVSVLVLFCAGLFVFVNVGRWLVHEDPLEKGQAIVVLSGGVPVRAMEAAKLYNQGFAPRIWLTEPHNTLQSLGVPYEGEDALNQHLLIRSGVPATSIRILQPPIVNTADEIKAIAGAMAPGDRRPVIVVTSKAHTRRVRALWNRVAKNRGQAVVRAASADRFDAVHWWRTTTGALQVIREVLGLLNVWAGLPLRPAPG